MSTAIVQAETFNKSNAPTASKSDDKQVDNTTRRDQIVKVLAAAPRTEFRVPEIAEAINASQSQVSGLLSQMSDEPGLSRVGRGVYVYGLDKKVWAESKAGRPKATAKPKVKSTSRPAKAKKVERKVEGNAADLGWTEVGTVFRDPQGRLVMVTPLSPEVAAALGS